MLPEYLSDLGVETIRKNGVTVIPNASKISAKCLQDGQIQLKINDDRTVLTDHVVVAAGIEPNTQLAVSAGLDLDEQNGGIAANEFLETSKKNIFVAGDVASYPSTLGNRRIEHHDNAIITGKHAGDSMIGMYVFFHGIFVELTFFIFHCKINLFLQQKSNEWPSNVLDRRWTRNWN